MSAPSGYPGPPAPAPPAPRRRLSGVWVAVAVVCAVFVVLLGVTLALLLPDRDDDGAAADPGASSSSASEAPPTSGDSSTATPLEGDVVVADDVDLQWFRSPSGNITCALARGGDAGPASADCAVGNVTWTVEPEPACELDWAGGQDGLGRVAVSGEDPGSVVCAGDALDPGDTEVVEVPYGQAIWLTDEIVCRSAESGMRCESLQSGHGFSVSRGAVDLY